MVGPDSSGLCSKPGQKSVRKEQGVHEESSLWGQGWGAGGALSSWTQAPAPEALPKAGGCRRLSAWPDLWRLSPTRLCAGAGQDLRTGILESGNEF